MERNDALSINYILLLTTLLTSFYFLSPCLAACGNGPLHTQNHFPPHLMFLKPMPGSSRSIPRNSLKATLVIDYSSVFLDAQSEEWLLLIDLEMTVVDISLEYGLTTWLSFSVDMPFVSMNSGFLDGFLETYHTTFDFPNYGREKRPKNDFAYYIKKNNQDWFYAEQGGCHIADSTISFNFHVNTASLSYTVKMPTGSEEKGFGSGHVDHGFFLFSQFSLRPFTIYLNPSVIILSDPKTLGPDIPVKNMFGLFGALEYPFNQSLSLISQLDYYTSPFENTRIKQLDSDSMEITFGLIYRIGRDMDVEFGFSEDLFHAAPDFTVHTAIRYGFPINRQ
ncbi:MAG: DUF3187 family protein [bacterium]